MSIKYSLLEISCIFISGDKFLVTKWGTWPSLIASVFLSVSLVGLAQKEEPQPEKLSNDKAAFFESKIRPLLAKECYGCHSSSSKPLMGGLRVDSKSGLLAGGVRGSALVPGSPEKSLIYTALTWQDPKLQMPPRGKLSEQQVAAIRQWIEMGAPDPRTATSGPKKQTGLTLEQGRKFWSFQPLTNPTVPVMSSPWVKNDIDRFVLKKLTSYKLTPNPSADKLTLIRRAYFNLIGLPPTPDSVNRFMADKSLNAYEKLVDSLLSNKHYGERWARHWLDLARFAESHGYEQDYDRPNAYHYRDFLIDAFNEDLPYDQFVKWQLAGDEYEPDNPAALKATGFLAAGTHATQITKSQVEKERYDELDDMLSTSSSVFLGLTVGCARCHNHKYDPIPQEDYYRMLATFTTTVRSDFQITTDKLEYEAAKREFDYKHAPLLAQVEKYDSTDLIPALLTSLASVKLDSLRKWTSVKPVSSVSSGGAVLTADGADIITASGKNPDFDTYTIKAKHELKGVKFVRLEVFPDKNSPANGPGRAPNGNFALSDFSATVSGSPIKLSAARADFEQKGLPVSAAIDADPRSAWAIDGQIGKPHAAIFQMDFSHANLITPSESEITFVLKFNNNNGHNIAKFRLSLSSEDDKQYFASPVTSGLNSVISKVAATGTLAGLPTADQKQVLDWYKTVDPERSRLVSVVDNHLKSEPKPKVITALISSEGVPAVRTHTQGGDFLPETHFLLRGDPNQKQRVVNQGFLQALVRTPEGEARWVKQPPAGWRTSYRRRSYAEWITDTDRGAGNLLARVIVNRLWQKHFGKGLVSTPSDFGTQGERPTNPELLDYLAVQLIKNKWQLKPIQKLIMTSATFMQSSAIKPVNTKLDPSNNYLSHQNRRRLEAEIIRDSMLAVSGKLDDKMYGPGVLDEKMNRRSIYFFVKRSKLIPSMMLFDAPNALGPLPARASTTVAPQALMMMNNAQVRSWSESFAKEVMAVAPHDYAAQVNNAYRLAFGRLPDLTEKNESVEFLKAQEKEYKLKSDATNVELYAMTDLCQALFGLNEFIYVE